MTLHRFSPAMPPANMQAMVCRYSNLVLTDSDRRIEACGRQVSSKMSSKRSLQTGQVYELPPEQSGCIPSVTESLLDWRGNIEGSAGEGQNPSGLASALSKSYRVCLSFK